MKIKEVECKSILSKSQIMDYCVNCYVGCQHACVYCYARFMARFTEHTEPWGEFVDVKINAPVILEKQLLRARPGRVMMSSVCDGWQPLERKYKLSRVCSEASPTPEAGLWFRAFAFSQFPTDNPDEK